MSQVAVDTASLRLTDVRSRLKAIFIGSIGNLVEWRLDHDARHQALLRTRSSRL